MAATRKPTSKLGRRLKLLRVRSERTQAEAASAAGIPIGHYQKLEYGLLDPKLTTLKRLANAFAVPLSELLEGL